MFYIFPITTGVNIFLKLTSLTVNIFEREFLINLTKLFSALSILLPRDDKAKRASSQYLAGPTCIYKEKHGQEVIFVLILILMIPRV